MCLPSVLDDKNNASLLTINTVLKFLKKENIDLLFGLVTAFNEKQETLSNIHIAVLNIEKSN